ncbi:MAG: DEAD/DEAH box helicase [Thermoguttaceae bacterium]|nr:DEAD/DEAH box helicase [Thermoguttaceae bacterium]
MGYSEPTPIQAGAIPTVQTGVDLMGQAKTGTGKTAAFMIPIVEGVADCEPGDSPLALVVVPTRELAVQVRDEAVRIAKCYDISFAACYGGRPLASQVEKLRSGVDILVGTPGRILDLSSRGALSLARVKWVVLDEADRMLDIGFRPDVERILRLTPKSRQTLLFSATLAPPVVSLAKSYMKDPVQVDFSQKDVSADTIEQFYVTVDQDRKFDALVRLLEVQDPRQAIVFCRTKRCVDRLTRKLAEKFDSVEAIHGDLAQTKRDHIMRDFRAEKIRIMVATDVVGRGIDVSTVSHIVNYDIPQYCDDYVHRVGRAGRMGREGVAFTLVTAEEGSELTRIEIRINRLLERYDVPGFEALTRHAQTDDEEKVERKPVFGKAVRRERRAL